MHTSIKNCHPKRRNRVAKTHKIVPYQIMNLEMAQSIDMKGGHTQRPGARVGRTR